MSKNKNHLPDFKGPFCKLIPEYIGYKRAQGHKIYPPLVYRLREMDLFFKEIGILESVITREMYEAWTRPKPTEKETTTEKRRSALKGFAKYLVAKGYSNIYTGYDDCRRFKPDFIPYIFSVDEILRMFKVLANVCSCNPTYENETFRLIMMMYYCCGFRKSEVLNLRVRDVDTETGKVTVLNGKNGVSRIVLMSDSMLSLAQNYYRKYHENSSPDEFFVHGVKSNSYCHGVLYKKFHKLLVDAGIPVLSNGTKQRIHDIRHTFCVRALESMQEKGFDLYISLPLLSTYLGHKSLTETEYYLRMVEEHFGNILRKTASYSPGLFPKNI
jgi:integrase